VKFNKPPLTLPQQLAKWQSRGLVVDDAAKAIHYLRFIGYYLIGIIALQSRWHERLASLMVKHSSAGLRAMGFPLDWRTQPFWGLNEGDFMI